MRKWTVAAAILVVTCVIALAALWNLNSLIKRNKDYLLSQAEQALGRKVAVGEIEATLLGGIGVRLSDFVLGDDPAYSKGDFLRAKDLQINLKLWPLLKKQFQVKRVILREPKIEIIRNRKGDFNFSTLGKKDTEKKFEEGAKEKKERAPASSRFLVSLVDMSGGTLRYRDQRGGAPVELKQLDLILGDLDFDRPLSVELAASLFSNKQNLKVKTRVGPFPSSGDQNRLPLDGLMSVDPLDIASLQAALPSINDVLPSDLRLSGIFRIKEIKFKGTPRELVFTAGLDASEGAIRYGRVFSKPHGIAFTLTAEGKYTASSLTLRRANTKLHNLELAARGELGFGESPELNFTVDTQPASLEGWEKIISPIAGYQLTGKMEARVSLRGRMGRGIAPEIVGALNLTEASAKPPGFPKAIKDLNAKITFTGQRADVKETSLSLGTSRIQLAAAIDKFSPLTLTYKLSTPELRPADFQASLAEERQTDVIKNLRSEGRLVTQNGDVTYHAKLISSEGTLYKIRYKDLDTDLTLANKVASIRNLRANAMGGSLQVDGEYAFDSSIPRFSIASRVRGVDVKELYSTLSPKAERDVRGRLNADMKATGKGQSWEEINPTLNGQGEAEVLQGALLNFNIAEATLTGITGVPGLTQMINPRLRQKYPETFQAKDTEFKEMNALFDLAGGRINVKSLRIAAADYSVQGKGWADFDRKVDFRSVLMFSQRLSADLGDSAREVRYLFNNQNQLEIPFALTGRLPNVKPKPDSNYLAQMVQRGLLRRGTEELQRRFFGSKEPPPASEPAPTDPKRRRPSSTEELIRKGFEGLFGR
jgi:uncharacterized protein involved in outer membrane biogenesis